MNIKPFNRHILIELCDSDGDEPENTILLPDEYKPKELHTLATIVSTASDCKESLVSEIGSKIVCTSNMIEEVKVSGKSYYLLLENYVLCLVS